MPNPAFMRAWTPLASRGVSGPALAYLRRVVSPDCVLALRTSPGERPCALRRWISEVRELPSGSSFFKQSRDCSIAVSAPLLNASSEDHADPESALLPVLHKFDARVVRFFELPPKKGNSSNG
jgi:hypothetical protein